MSNKKPSAPPRLDRLLAATLAIGRKEVKALLKEGRVRLEGRVVSDGATKISAERRDHCSVDGLHLKLRLHYHLMMNKAEGFLTAMADRRDACVADLLSQDWLKRGLVPCGRLDKDSHGLLLFSNDGELCHRLCSPRREIEKEYRIRYSGPVLGQAEIDAFHGGMTLEDGTPLKSADLEILPGAMALARIREGKYRQLRRMFLCLGREIVDLQRLREGPLCLDPTLAPSQYRPLSEKESAALYEAADLSEADF